MIMGISVDEIRDIAQLFFHETPQERINQCSRMTSIMEMELEDHPEITTPPTRHQGAIVNNGESVGHMFLTLPADEVQEATDGPVIIDVSVQQFCKDNYVDGEVKVEVESVIDIPEDAGVFTPNDKAHELYQF